MRRALAVIGLLGLACLATARAQACAAPTQMMAVAVPGHPFSAIASADGCWLFASLTIDRQQGAIAVLRNRQQVFVLDHVGPLPAPANGAALSPDGQGLAVATGNGASVFAVDRLERPNANVPATPLHNALGAQAVYTRFSRDGHWLFVSQERTASISVFDLGQADGDGLPHASLAGRIPVASAPVGLAVRPDGTQVWVALSDRFSAAGTDKLVGVMLVGGKPDKLPDTSVVGGFPREVAFLPDGRALVATVFGSERIELISTP